MKYLAVPGVLIWLLACRNAPKLPEYGEVPDFRLTDQNGQVFSGHDLNGKVWVADFFFTNCMGPCPRMTSRLHEVQQETSSMPGLQLVSFTIDPANDTPVAMAAYAKEHGASTTRWHFLTGGQPALQQLCRNVFLLGNVDGSLTHSTKFILIDRKMRIRGYYDSFDPDEFQKLLKDVRALERS